MRVAVKSAWALSLCIGMSLMAQPLDLDRYTANYKIGYEKIAISSDEDMGLVGLSVLFDTNDLLFWRKK